LYFAPTLCVYGLCFKINNSLLPEIGTVMKTFFKVTGIIVAYARSSDDEAPLQAMDIDQADMPLRAEPVASIKVNPTN